jgi:hypothetical protein
MLKWAKSVGALFTAETVRAAMRHGDIEMVEYLIADNPALNKAECYKHAINYWHMPMLRWLDERYGNITPDVEHLRSAASQGHLEVCQYLREQGYVWDDDSSEAVTEAARYEHHDLVKWLITEGCPYAEHDLGMAIVGNYDSTDNSVNMLKWLSEHGAMWEEYTLTRMLDECGVNSQLEAAKYVKQLGAAWPTEFLINHDEHGDEEGRVMWHHNVREWAISAGCRAPIVNITSEYYYH